MDVPPSVHWITVMCIDQIKETFLVFKFLQVMQDPHINWMNFSVISVNTDQLNEIEMKIGCQLHDVQSCYLREYKENSMHWFNLKYCEFLYQCTSQFIWFTNLCRLVILLQHTQIDFTLQPHKQPQLPHHRSYFQEALFTICNQQPSKFTMINMIDVQTGRNGQLMGMVVNNKLTHWKHATSKLKKTTAYSHQCTVCTMVVPQPLTVHISL